MASLFTKGAGARSAKQLENQAEKEQSQIELSPEKKLKSARKLWKKSKSERRN